MTDANDYYPFGMNHLKTGNAFFGSGSYKNYKYNGKELQETGMYDYGARFYMPDLGRWGVADELAEKSRRFSPYTYALDNPIMFVDPDGREAQGCCGNLWNLAKTYYSGMYQGARSVATGTYQGVKQVVTHPIESAKSLASNPGGALKSGISKSTNLMASVAAFPAIAGASVKKGDATVAGNIAGKALGTAVIEGGMAVATEGAGSLVRNIASKAGGTAAKAVVGASEGVNYGKMLTSTSEFDPSKTLFRGTTGSEAGSSALFLTDDAAVAGTYIKNGGQVMQYDLSNSGLYMLEKTGELEYKTGIHSGSNTISTEYLFKGKDLVKAVPHNP
ncbi:RHS repeat-associated core domain-containing protein [Chryseobacterium sp. ES2]|uniref:RHS repeat-associated core domain-containing protein n=1 Tax=Chryseobacterium metallicongregator TaxID=3073042 RepID=A0ABU1E7L0_9FLAO|nr:RHS repeat-associated core domain-containing protein [Chryseobacterium sp. ES2]MDR4953814.1 RHS repeat-associated core domain-containing protein [Chryseobacterium sp. ES2]